MPEHLLSFELTEAKDQLIIHGDEAGLRFLIETLKQLVAHTKDGHFDHAHLKTLEWGGDELSSASQGGTVLNHVKVYCWKGNLPQD